MSRIFLAKGLIGLLSLISFAQSGTKQITEKPNFTGTWEIENKKSNPFKNQTLIINQTGEALTLTQSFEHKGKPFSNETTLYLDQRGEKNRSLMPGADFQVEIRSTTSWKKDRLIRRLTYSSPFITGANVSSVVTRETETFSLSKDGDTLTVEKVGFSDTPFGTIPTTIGGKRVYRRKN